MGATTSILFIQTPRDTQEGRGPLSDLRGWQKGGLGWRGKPELRGRQKGGLGCKASQLRWQAADMAWAARQTSLDNGQQTQQSALGEGLRVANSGGKPRRLGTSNTRPSFTLSLAQHGSRFRA